MGELINWINVSQNAAFRIDVDVILGLRIILLYQLLNFNIKTLFYHNMIPIIKIRHSKDRLTFYNGNPIAGKTVLILKRGPD